MPLVPSTQFAGVLFDKDGTLIDFHLTWGPAVFAIIHALAAGNPALMKAQAETLHYSIETKRFLRSSPLVAGSTADYGARWADALGRSDLDVLKSEIDALSATESLKALTPIDEPLAVFSALSAMGLRLGVATNDSERSARRQIEALGIATYVDFVAGYDSGHGGKPEPGMVLAFADFLGAPPSRHRHGRRFAARSRAARAAGAVAVAVLSGPPSGPRSSLTPITSSTISALCLVFSRAGAATHRTVREASILSTSSLAIASAGERG